MKVSPKQERIAMLAEKNPEMVFTSLNQYLTKELLKASLRKLNKNSAVGVDGISVEDYNTNADGKLEELITAVKTGKYRAPSVKRVYIPKSKNEKRPLGIPTTEDKILQKAVLTILEPIYEKTYYDFSYGFRPEKSAQQALQKIWETAMRMGGCWILDIDIKKYFDSIGHEHLRNFLQRRVNDGVITRLIGKWLKAGIMEDGSIRRTIYGTPQGGIISPLLSNIFLHYVLDEWFVKQVKPCLKGQAELIRYADDFVILVKNEKDAGIIMDVIPKRLGKYGLTMNLEKSRMINFSRSSNERGSRNTFNFLGFKHFWGKSLRGNDIIVRKTSSKSFCKGIKAIHEWIKRNRHRPVAEQCKALSAKLAGHFNYFGITGNSRRLEAFKDRVQIIWHYWLSRRSNRSWITWDKFNLFLLIYPLPRAKIYHSYV
jgi:group II intron reverse transcriptase/maturase